MAMRMSAHITATHHRSVTVRPRHLPEPDRNGHPGCPGVPVWGRLPHGNDEEDA